MNLSINVIFLRSFENAERNDRAMGVVYCQHCRAPIGDIYRLSDLADLKLLALQEQHYEESQECAMKEKKANASIVLGREENGDVTLQWEQTGPVKIRKDQILSTANILDEAAKLLREHAETFENFDEDEGNLSNIAMG